MLTCLLAAAALAAAKQDARTGLAQLRLAADPTKCVAISQHKRAGPGSRAVIWACDPQKRPSGQLFTYDAATGTISYGDYCLRVSAWVELARCDGDDRQRFFWDAFGTKHIEHGRLCLTANATANGAPLVAGAPCLAFSLDKFQQEDDCALLTRRQARFPAFAFTSPYAVVAPSTPALRVASRSLDEFLAADVPRFALGTGSTPGWTTCGGTKADLRRFAAFERVLWLDVRTLAVGALAPLFLTKLDAPVAVGDGAALIQPDAFSAISDEVQQLDAAGMLVRGDAVKWDAEALRADAADAEKRRVAATHPAVFVTGYWSMPSKHASSLYSKWIGRLMEVDVPLVIFTNDKSELKKKRLQHIHLTKFVHREIADFHTQRAFGEVWRRDFQRDREAHIHKSPRLYAIWAEKLEHVEIVRRRQFFGAGRRGNSTSRRWRQMLSHTGDIDAIFWIDIGVLRDTGAQYQLATGRSGAWPRPSRVDAIVATGRVHIAAAMPCWGPREFARPDQIDGRFDKKNHVCACIFGGSGAAVRRTRIAYYDLTRRFIARNKFSGKDQSVWNFLVVQNRSFLSLVVPDRCPGDRWFAMVSYLADACHGPPSRHYEGRTCLRDVSGWSGHPEEGLGAPLPTVTTR